MAYDEHFKLADDYLVHLDSMFDAVDDDFIKGRYLGFVLISAVTVYELAIKEIFCDFSRKKHIRFGQYVENSFEKLNGRIGLEDLKNRSKKFGEQYRLKFQRKLDSREQQNLRDGRGSIRSAYGNMLTWRNSFVHSGQSPRTTNYGEIKNSYESGKLVILSLAEAMTR
ncbi:MAG: hypothetical protein GC188_05815 [Alphaproteobacteria bacterium]|nr:hypothetical protein [Alphaproteobacteria bacterium]